MQKIRNRSLFFQKISHIRYIAKNFESVQALSGILPKILKTVPLFWKNLPHRVYFQNFWKRSHFSELFSKNLSMASSGRPDIGISAISYAPIRQIRQNSPLSGLFPQWHPSVLPHSEKIRKNITSTPVYARFLPPKFSRFSKKIEKFLYPHLPITDFEWFMCQFELKAPSEKVQSCPTYIATLA